MIKIAQILLVNDSLICLIPATFSNPNSITSVDCHLNLIVLIDIIDHSILIIKATNRSPKNQQSGSTFGIFYCCKHDDGSYVMYTLL